MAPEAQKIRRMFTEIADRYDITNDVLSLGVHKIWKNKVIVASGATRNSHVLDCATGTGDLAFLFRERVGAEGRVVGTDFCAAMLDKAKERSVGKSVSVEFYEQDAQRLEMFKDNSFDTCTMAFGIRNVEQPSLAIHQMHRVLKKGGFLVILEFGQPEAKLFKSVYRIYSDRILPTVGSLLTGGKKGAYHYLNQSAAQFPCGKEFQTLIEKSASFESVTYEALTGGIAYLYTAIKK
jgi:demethylmenaquinone methyltransferase/2-methoxy-6-polyprenyl-1,4-benzoquinol methylase